jgi:hypothetical protein
LLVLRYRHLILLHTQMHDGCRHLPTIREWPTEFGPYALGHQPRSGKRKVSTQAYQELKPKPYEEKEIHVATKRKTAVPKYRSISAIRDFSPIPGRFNHYLSDEEKRVMHT